MINQHGITEYPNSIKRQYSAPLEYYYSFNSWENANEYAQKNPTAYEGQIVAVTQNNDKVLLYYLTKSIFSNCNYDLILMSDSEKYGEYSLINHQVKFIPDISYCESYRIIHDNTVTASHYDFISDNQIIDYSDEDDVLNTLKFICEKKDENNKYVEIMRLDTKVVDNNELFTVGYLYKTPKVGSYKVQKSSDTTIKIIISLSAPYNIIKKEIMKQHWTVVEMPSGSTYDCSVDSDKNIIIDISQHPNITDMFLNENNVINLKPANADINFILNLSKEVFNKDGNIVSGKLYKGEYNIKIDNNELLQYYGTTNIAVTRESYFTVNETGETITGINDANGTTSGTLSELVIPYKINGELITTLYSGTGLKSILGVQALSSKTQDTLVEKIVIPNSITSIGDHAFYWSKALTSINIPGSVTSIGEWIFAGCSSLTSIDIPDSITSITNNAFDGCTSLTSISIPIGVTSIGDNAFMDCTSLTSAIIPSSVTSISDYAFYTTNSNGDIDAPISGLTIYCKQGSYAETYALANNIPIIFIE